MAKHPSKALSAVRINSIREPGRYGDGNGLYLIVDPSGAKRWVLRIVVHGRRRDIGLGGLKLVSLADARDQALEYRKLARSGGNPLEAKRKARTVVPTFADAARKAFEEHKAGWRNEKHASQWITTLSTYAFPILGELRVDEIETPHVLQVLSPIWVTKAETARRVRQRISAVLDWAKAAGYRSGENPTSGVGKGLPRQTDSKGHFSAMPYADVPKFVAKLQATNSIGLSTRLALQFLILTATRTNEVLKASWDEIDLTRRVWTIPAERMKAGREHRVPLTSTAIAILEKASEVKEGDLIFPGRTSGESLSNMALLMALRRMGQEVTAHGFRSAFRDWASETTNFARDVCEMALAHTIKDKTEAAYRRGDLFVKRQELMSEWSNWVKGKK